MDHSKAKYTYEDFLEIIKVLRSDQGCPWDREQTHESLKPCMIEEAAEVLAAIRIYERTGSWDNLQEELGDVLLQVVMHSQIASEEGIFTMEDVIHEVAAKMVRRHPHVFGEVTVDGSSQVLENWEEIKRREKEDKTYIPSPLREIPSELPALARAAKVLKKVDKLYEPQDSYQGAVERIKRGAELLEQAGPKSDETVIREQIGDILMAVSDLSRICKLSPEQILTDRIEEVIERYEEEA